MTNAMTTRLEGQLFDGVSLTPRFARLTLADATALLELETSAEEFPLASVRVSPRVFDAPRFVTLPNGWELTCAEQPGLERLTPHSASEGPVAWLERRVGVAVAAVLATLGGVALAYFFGLPRLAEAVAARVPAATERTLGEKTLSAFNQGDGAATELDDETVEAVRLGFDALKRGAPSDLYTRLEFRDAPSIGPNAFALPGGIVVITDQLVETCTVDEAVVVLAHEIGHVEHRHALKHVVEELGVGSLGALFGADTSTLSFSLSSLPLVLANAHYSQSFESDADAEGFRLASKAGYSPELFATCLQKLAKKAERADDPVLGYVASHPPDAERIARAHRAAEAFTREHAKPR